MAVTYVEVITSPVDGAEYISEVTWANENDDHSLTVHHYFVDYPGAKSLERALTEIVGGKPLVRYSSPTVLRTLLNDIPDGNIVAFSDTRGKQLVKALFLSSGSGLDKAFCTFDEVIADDEERSKVMDLLYGARAEAASRFGNAL